MSRIKSVWGLVQSLHFLLLSINVSVFHWPQLGGHWDCFEEGGESSSGMGHLSPSPLIRMAIHNCAHCGYNRRVCSIPARSDLFVGRRRKRKSLYALIPAGGGCASQWLTKQQQLSLASKQNFWLISIYICYDMLNGLMKKKPKKLKGWEVQTFKRH